MFATACSPMLKSPRKMEAPETGKNSVPTDGQVRTVILDGLWGWHTRWEPLRRKIEAGVGPCQIWHYDTTGFVSIEAMGRKLADDLRGLDGPFRLVGYSMGGIVIREAMRQAPELQLQRAVLLNSPHSGTIVAHLLPISACKEMRPGSAFLRRLDAAPWEYPTMVSWCPADLTVVPGHSARWQRATHFVRCDFPWHDWPVISGGIHRSVIEFLAVK